MMNALDEIIEWSESDAPLWMRDALRRAILQAEFKEGDIEELTELCKQPHGLALQALTAEVPAREGLPTGGSNGTVSIESLEHVSDVNALAPNEVLTFGPGLTVIYGGNGAGKSGYSRILKRACGARGSGDPILPNALSEQAGGTPKARLRIAKDGRPSDHLWSEQNPFISAFAPFNVFDSSAAQIYVASKTEMRFRPFGLDILDRIAAVTALVKSRLSAEKRALEEETLILPGLDETTQAGKFIRGLTALSSVDELKELATLTVEEQNEFKRLEDVLASIRTQDPRKKATEDLLKINRLDKIKNDLEALQKLFGGEQIAILRSLVGEQEKLRAAERILADSFSENSHLPGFGSAEWHRLWSSAQEFSTSHAYKDHDFPYSSDGARCVLCQQLLDQEARERFDAMKDFALGTISAKVREKDREVQGLLEIMLSSEPVERVRSGIPEVRSTDTLSADGIARFLDNIQLCRKGSQEGQFEPISIEPPIQGLKLIMEELSKRAQAFERAANGAAQKEDERRHAELKGRITLKEHEAKIRAAIDRKARINAFEACMRDTDTRALTTLSSNLTKKYVTQSLAHAFAEELGLLGFDSLELELAPAGAQKGVLYHQVRLRHATRAELPSIASEGESRCIALAAFLAELKCASHPSGIVFDDPVSSLDHRWRARVAKRLVAESRERQVIVFTHELVFLSALIHEAEELKIPHSTLSVRRGAQHLAGYVDTALPWNGLSVQKRIGALKNRHQELDKVYRTLGEKAYEPDAIRLYADLRRTWERALEETLFNGVVVRFRDSIQTSRLKKVDILQDDLDSVEQGMTKCSKWEGGHDQAEASNEPVPAPEEILADIGALEAWVTRVDKRRK